VVILNFSQQVFIATAQGAKTACGKMRHQRLICVKAQLVLELAMM
jgi:hypothetical protein